MIEESYDYLIEQANLELNENAKKVLEEKLAKIKKEQLKVGMIYTYEMDDIIN